MGGDLAEGQHLDSMYVEDLHAAIFAVQQSD
jgi:hypothetical protein